MSYTHTLRTQGVSPAGAEEVLRGEPLTSPVDRTTMVGLTKRARSDVFRTTTADAAVQTPAIKLARAGSASFEQSMAEGRAKLEAQRLAAIRAELERIQKEIEYWTQELDRLKSRLKALFVERSYARRTGSATAASEANLAKLEEAIEEQVAWIEEQLDALEKQRKELQSTLNVARAKNLELARTGSSVLVGGTAQSAQNPVLVARAAEILAELARLAEEIESLKKQIERRFHELHYPPIPRPPASAGLAALNEWMKYARARERQIIDAIRMLQQSLSELQAEYVQLLAQL